MSKKENLSKKRKRGWVFTWNNYTEEDEAMLSIFPEEDKITYMVYGREKGKKNETPHLQGYVEFKNPQSFDSVRYYFYGANVEPRLGSPQQASEYCKKDGDFVEWGVHPKQGKRSDFDAIKELIEEGYTIREIAWAYPGQYIRYSKGIEKMYELNQSHRVEPPKVVWLWGKAGVGKSGYAYKKHDTVFIKDETKWWSDYDHEEAVVIDDFDPDEWSYRRFLRLCDGYPYTGETKGSFVRMNSKAIYITCEYPPEHFWKDNKLDQVVSRFSEIINVQGKNRRKQPKRSVYVVESENETDDEN